MLTMISISAILCALHDTTERWNANPEFIPKEGEIIVYTDYGRMTDLEGAEHLIPGIKIGDGRAYLIDLPFVGASDRADILKALADHINDNIAHVTTQERTRWNHKLDDATYTSNGELLVITRETI